MGRLRSEWEIERQLRRRQARSNFFRSYEGPPEGTQVRSRGESTNLFYRSLLLKDGTDHQNFSVSVDNDTLAVVSAAQAGLLTALPATETATRLRGSGVRPSKASWYRGDPNPTRVRSRWGTGYNRYYAANSHKSIPFSAATGEFEGATLITRFNTLFGPGGTLRNAIGVNGRAELEFETVSISQIT